MPNIRKPREYDPIKTYKIAEALTIGRPLDKALETVDITLADHYRWLQTEKDYKSLIDTALQNRSAALFERLITLEEELATNELASSTDVAAIKTRADLIKQVAMAYDRRFNSSNNKEIEEKGETFAEYLDRVTREREGG